jgi:hypothetical protein
LPCRVLAVLVDVGDWENNAQVHAQKEGRLDRGDGAEESLLVVGDVGHGGEELGGRRLEVAVIDDSQDAQPLAVVAVGHSQPLPLARGRWC